MKHDCPNSDSDLHSCHEALCHRVQKNTKFDLIAVSCPSIALAVYREVHAK